MFWTKVHPLQGHSVCYFSCHRQHLCRYLITFLKGLQRVLLHKHPITSVHVHDAYIELCAFFWRGNASLPLRSLRSSCFCHFQGLICSRVSGNTYLHSALLTSDLRSCASASISNLHRHGVRTRFPTDDLLVPQVVSTHGFPLPNSFSFLRCPLAVFRPYFFDCSHVVPARRFPTVPRATVCFPRTAPSLKWSKSLQLPLQSNLITTHNLNNNYYFRPPVFHRSLCVLFDLVRCRTVLSKNGCCT